MLIVQWSRGKANQRDQPEELRVSVCAQVSRFVSKVGQRRVAGYLTSTEDVLLITCIAIFSVKARFSFFTGVEIWVLFLVLRDWTVGHQRYSSRAAFSRAMGR